METRRGPLAGTKKDGERMKRAFERLGIATIWRHNVRKAELEQILQGAAQLDPRVSNFETISFVFAGHGDADTIIMQDDPMDLQDVIKAFSPPAARLLGDIPKLFFIDACRGQNQITSVSVPAVWRAGCSRLRQQHPLPTIIQTPKEANVLIAFSTIESYQAGDSPNGSKWIEILADTLCKSSDDIDTILTQVRGDFRCCQQATALNRGVQLPETRSTLCKRVFLNKFRREPQHQSVRVTPTYHHYVPRYRSGFSWHQVVHATHGGFAYYHMDMHIQQGFHPNFFHFAMNNFCE